MDYRFPDIMEVPNLIWDLDGHCGPFSAWWALRYFRKRIAAKQIIKKVRYANNQGTFMICLAVALKDFGLKIEFFSDPDPSPHYYEQIAYRRANKLGVKLRRAVPLDKLLSKLNETTIALVLYQPRDDTPHITPLLGKRKQKLIAPLAGGELSVHKFEWGWKQPGILRQAIIVRAE